MVIRDPYVFEFLGLRPKEVMSESHLEDQFINKPPSAPACASWGFKSHREVLAFRVQGSAQPLVKKTAGLIEKETLAMYFHIAAPLA